MELRHLRYFSVVAEELNFSRAAERLHISQPPLSRQIRDLERALGADLFVREKRAVRLTPAGEWLRGEAESLLSKANWIERHVRNMGMSCGTYFIGYTGSLLFEFLPELVTRFREKYPGWTVSVRELGSEAQVKAILSGELDVGFVRDRSRGRGLEYRELSIESLSAIIPGGWELPTDTPQGLHSLATLPFIGLPRAAAPSLVDRIMDLCALAGFCPDIILECSQLYSVLRFVSKGLGWSIVSTSALRNLELDIKSVNLTFEQGRHGLGILRRSDDVRGMAEFIEHIFKELVNDINT